MLCLECKKKPTCKTICKELENDLHKQEHYQREVLIHNEDLLSLIANDESINPHDYDEMVQYFTPNKPLAFPFLTPLQNKILHLFYFEGLTYKQIASRLSSANQHGNFVKLSSTQVDYQIRSAKRDILRFFPICRRNK